MAGSEQAPVIYEVRLTVTSEVEADFDDWLAEHTRRMLAFEGFGSARVIRPEPAPDGRPRRIVRYHLRDRAVLNDYLENHAAAMRAEAVERFGEALQAERDIYPALPGDHSGDRCPNCGTPAPNQFCPACGQEQKDVHRSFWRLMHDFLGDTFTFDSRLVRSLRPLIARPGFLTREYLDGRRARYIPPLRLYLFISVLFFTYSRLIVGGLDMTGGTIVGDEAGKEWPAFTVDMKPDSKGVTKFQLEPAPGQEGPESGLERRILSKGERLNANPHLVADRVLRNLPLGLFLLMPLYALVMRLLYPFAGYVYLEHLIFALHVHAFTFLVLGLIMSLSFWVPGIAPSARLGWVYWMIFGYLLIYPWMAMKRVYRQSVAMTTFKYLMQALIYFVMLLSGLIFVVLATIYWF